MTRRGRRDFVAMVAVAMALAPAAHSADTPSLRALHVADCYAKERQALQGGGGADVRMPVFAYLLTHPQQGAVIIDAGFPQRSVGHPEEYPGAQASRLLRLQVHRSMAGHLADVGLTPADVRVVTVTHLHSDHGGGIEDFPDARFVVHEREWKASGHKRDAISDAAAAWRGHTRVEFPAMDDGAFGAFPRHEDLFGDGTVRIVETRGHTRGHVSVVVELEGRTILLVGDAAWLNKGWQEVRPKGAVVRSLLEVDGKATLASLRAVRLWHEQHPQDAVFAGHDPSLLDHLPPWPDPWSWARWDNRAR